MMQSVAMPSVKSPHCAMLKLRTAAPRLPVSARSSRPVMRVQRLQAASQPEAAAADPAATTGKDDVTGAMLAPSLSNNNWVRAGAVIATVSAVAGSSVLVPERFAVLLHILSYAVWTGTNIWNTFFVGLTLFKNMPRQQFGRIQAKLFPQFFILTTAANILLLGTLLLVGDPQAAGAQTAAITLTAALVASLAEWLVIEPKCTGLMFERYDLENKAGKTEEDAAKIQALYGDFGKWHGVSAVVNLGIICATFAHGWFLAAALKL